jgi:hypothetical protein
MRVHSQGAKEARAGLRSRCLRLAACRFLRSELILQPLLPAAAADLLSCYKPEHKYRQATCQRSLRPTDGTVPRVRLPDLHSDRSIAVADRPHVPTCACVWCLRFDGMRTRAFVSVPTCTYGCVPLSSCACLHRRSAIGRGAALPASRPTARSPSSRRLPAVCSLYGKHARVGA